MGDLDHIPQSLTAKSHNLNRSDTAGSVAQATCLAGLSSSTVVREGLKKGGCFLAGLCISVLPEPTQTGDPLSCFVGDCADFSSEVWLLPETPVSNRRGQLLTMYV